MTNPKPTPALPVSPDVALDRAAVADAVLGIINAWTGEGVYGLELGTLAMLGDTLKGYLAALESVHIAYAGLRTQEARLEALCPRLADTWALAKSRSQT